MAKRVIEDATLQSIAEAIREKAKTTDGMTPLQMPQAILDIKGAEIEENTNSSGGKTVYINSEPEKLPEGFTRLKYIQSDGRQYVDTLVSLNANVGVAISFVPLSTGSIFGAIGAMGSGDYYGLNLFNAKFEPYWGGSLGYLSSYTLGAEYYAEFNYSGRNVLVNGTDIASLSSATITDKNLYLFALNVGGTSKMQQISAQLKTCAVAVNNTLVRNYIPCLNASGEAGLWDTVTQAFYGDAAGVGFIAGPVVLDYELPEGFEELAWIESDGRQYADSGVVGTSNIKVMADFAWTALGGENVLIGEFSSASARCIPIYTDGSYWRYGYAGAAITSSTAVKANSRYQVESSMLAGAQSLVVDGVKVASGTTATAFDSGYTMTLFSLNVNGSVNSGYNARARLYFMQIYSNGTLVRYYVPCRTNTGEVGLWDAVNSEFYGDAAGVGFIAGPKKGVSKVVLEDETMIDLTGDTVTPEGLLAGLTAHDASGAQIIGELVQKAGGRPMATGTHTSSGTSSANLSVTGLSFRPALIFATNTSKTTNVGTQFGELDMFYDSENSLHIHHTASAYEEGVIVNTQSNTNYVTITDTSFTLTRFMTFGFKGTWRWWAFGAAE